MKYRLSLDLGVASVGSAIIDLNDENKAEKLIDAGVRIFKLSEGAEDRRAKRQARKNNKRTKKRLKLLAKKLYENGFWESEDVAGSKEIRDLSPYAVRSYAVNGKLNHKYELGRALLHLAKHRGAGFVDALESQENDDFEEENKKSKKDKKLSSYDNLAEHLNETGAKTAGEYFYMRLKPSYKNNTLDVKQHKHVVRQRKNYVGDNKPVDYAIPRYLVKDEFKQIWAKQAEYYEELKNEEFKQAVYDILFYEMPAAPYATADCIYIAGEKRLLKAHPLSEKRRVYEAVNNIRITTDADKRKLSLEERDKIINELALKGQNINKTKVREVLGFDKKSNVIFADEQKGISSYLYAQDKFKNLPVFQTLSEEKLTELVEFMAEPVNPNDKQGRLYSEEDFMKELKRRLNINDEKQIGELVSKLPSDRGTLGKTATEKLLNLLKQDVISHREASDLLVSGGDDRFKAAEVLAQEIQGAYDELPYYGEILPKDTQPIHPWQEERNKDLNKDEAKYGKIANPAVHMMLNQLQKVVNDIIRIYGRPYEINIELAREVGMSVDKKKQYEAEKKKNEKLNEEAVEYLKEFKIKINRENILKYKLAKEQNWKNAFSSYDKDKIHPRFEGFEIEHLIPQAKGGTDTYSNLVLIKEGDNRSKSNLYPYEYFEKNKSPEEITAILEAVRNNSNMTDGKKWRFEPDAREKFESDGDVDETNRYLTDTRYMSKLAARYLRAILAPDESKTVDDGVVNTRILTVKGIHTATLRRNWNLDGLEYDLMGLDIPKYLDCYLNEETGEVIRGKEKPDIDGNWIFRDKKRNLEWKAKPRIDHRHHALDAITLGCINRNFVQEMNWSEKRGIVLRGDAYPLPLSGLDKDNRKAALVEFRNNVLNVLNAVKVSHKPEHSKNGQLHEETGKVILKLAEEYKDLTITKYHREVLNVVKKESDLSKLLISSSINDECCQDIAEDRKKLEELVDNFKKYFAEAKENLIKLNETLQSEGKKPIDVSENRILTEAFKIIQKNKLWKGNKFPTYTNEKSLIFIEKHQIAYKSGNNYGAIFYKKNEKVECKVINNFEANNEKYVLELKQEKLQPIWFLSQGDLVEFDTPDVWQTYIKGIRCLAEVRSFRYGRNQVSFILANDARNEEKENNKPDYMFPIFITDKSANSLEKIKARKIELTAFGKIKKKHKILRHGEKNQK